MRRALLALALLEIRQPGPALTIREGDRVRTVPVVTVSRRSMVRLDEATAPLGATLVRVAAERYRLDIGGIQIGLTLGSDVATIGDEPETMSTAPVRAEGRILVPLQLLTEVVPRRANGFLFDEARFELRRFAAVVGTVRSTKSPTAQAPRSSTSSDTRASRPAAAGRLVVIDAGHGGPDRGMRGVLPNGRRMDEADVTLAVAKRVRDALQARGVRVLMTRSTDTLIALSDRVASPIRRRATFSSPST